MFFRRRNSKQQVAQEERAAVKRPGWFSFFRESLSGFLFVTLIVGCLGLGAILWGWSQRDAYLTDLLRRNLQEKFPEWNITFGSAELDHHGRIVVADLQINPESSEVPLCSVDGLRISIDKDLLFDRHQIDVQSIEVNRPKIKLHRASSGKWNWENLPLIESGQGAPPVVKVRDAEVTLRWEHEQFARAIRVQASSVDADIIPVGKHLFRFQGVGQEEMLGSSQFTGEFDTLHKNWSLSGSLKGLLIDQPFLQTATLLSSQADQMYSQLKNSSLKNSTVRKNLSPISSETNLENEISLQLMADLEFHISKQAEEKTEFTLSANLVNGQLVHPGLPIPLDQIRGKIAMDRLGARLDQFVLVSGKTSAHVSGAWGWQPGNLPGNVREGFDVVLKEYRVTKQTRDYLPLNLQRVFNDLSPSGILSTSFQVKRGGNRPIDFDLKTATIREAAASHSMFSYPVQQVQGTIVRADNGIGPETWTLQFAGIAAGQPVQLTGTMIDPGPDYEMILNIEANKFPLDEQFYRALRPSERVILDEFNVQGMVDARCTVLRKLAVSQKPMMRLEADVYNASMRAKSFPWEINGLSGHVSSNENSWQFTRFEGKHGETTLRAFGAVLLDDGKWRTKMTVSADRARFDHDLRLACKVASSEIEQAWKSLNPRGEFELTATLEQIKGEPLFVEIPLMQLRKCELTSEAFPWRISEVDATVSVSKEGLVSFEKLKATHNHSRIETSGHFVSLKDYWQLRFAKLSVDDLFPDHEFMAALPKDFRELMESLKIKEPASLVGWLELKGDHLGEIVTAAWDANVVLDQTDLFLGVDVKDVSGEVDFKGMMDRTGTVTISDGKLALDSCWVKGYHVTDVKGPFFIDKNRIVVGSKKMFDADSPDGNWETVTRNERVTGRIFGGELFLDLMARRTEKMPYWLRCTLSRADLEKWAIQSNYGQANVRGEMNGYIDLAGDAVSTRNTVGGGQLLISPAALYELPVILQMFQTLRFTPVDGTAFRNAYAKFRVQDEKFVFDEIGLLGESMSLLGAGYIRFDRTIDLDFVYRPPTRTRINVVSQALNRLKDVLPVLFTVDVEGTLDVPKVTVNDGVRNTLQGFVKMLENGPTNLRPVITPPPQVQFPKQ